MKKIIMVLLVLLLTFSISVMAEETEQDDLNEYKESLLKYGEYRETYISVKEEYSSVLEELKSCESVCVPIKEKAIKKGKDYVNSSLNLMMARIFLEEAEAFFSGSYEEENIESISLDYQGLVYRLKSVQTSLKEVSDMEDLRILADNTREVWEDAVFSMRRNNYASTIQSLDGSISHANILHDRLECSLKGTGEERRSKEILKLLNFAENSLENSKYGLDNDDLESARSSILRTQSTLKELHVESLSVLNFLNEKGIGIKRC